MSIPKDQHYIPRMLLKRFTDKEGNLSFYDKKYPDKGVRKRAPKNLFYERHLYTQVEEDGTRDASVETEFLSRLENDASPVIEKIVASARRGQFPNLSSVEKDIFVKFFYNLFVRVPDVRDQYFDVVRQMVMDRLEFTKKIRPLTRFEQSLLDSDETLERHLRNGSIESVQMQTSENIIRILSEQRIGVAVIRNPKPKRSFVVGSHPLVKMSFPGQSQLSDPTIEVWLPLARDLAVSPCPGENDKIVSVKDRHIESINRSVFQQSKVIAGSSEKLIESLLGEEARIIRATAEK